MSAMRSDTVKGTDLREVEGEEHRFIDVGPTTIDFVLAYVEERTKCLFLVNEQLCSFYWGKITK